MKKQRGAVAVSTDRIKGDEPALHELLSRFGLRRGWVVGYITRRNHIGVCQIFARPCDAARAAAALNAAGLRTPRQVQKADAEHVKRIMAEALAW